MQLLQPQNKGNTKEERDKDDQEWEIPRWETSVAHLCLRQGDKDFPPAAAQVAHQKPHASIDKHPSPRTQHIQQPRK
uniref:Uncharacterized protein n=1 Tax=Urocitellus parryii TaxID=9999 RepID=A0A8D2I6U6_UROPR